MLATEAAPAPCSTADNLRKLDELRERIMSFGAASAAHTPAPVDSLALPVDAGDSALQRKIKDLEDVNVNQESIIVRQQNELADKVEEIRILTAELGLARAAQNEADDRANGAATTLSALPVETKARLTVALNETDNNSSSLEKMGFGERKTTTQIVEAGSEHVHETQEQDPEAPDPETQEQNEKEEGSTPPPTPPLDAKFTVGQIRLFFAPVNDGGSGHDATDLFGSNSPANEDYEDFLAATSAEDVAEMLQVVSFLYETDDMNQQYKHKYTHV